MSVLAHLQRLQEKKLSFRGLPYKMKVAIVGYLKTDGMLVEEIASICQISSGMVYKYNRSYTKAIAAILRKNASHHIGRLVARAENLYKSAKKASKLDLCWRIEIDLMDKLIKLGMVDARPDAPMMNVFVGADPDAAPAILEAELASDLSLLDRVKARVKYEVRPIESGGNGASNDPGEAGLSEGPPKRDDESEGEDLPGSA